ncbi:MAG: preprotein translocase subunit SecE [Gammaproteobacteria bacterium]|nr:preprotein translocase subunit SecE [Gammaproteobacteria bacterium]
MSTRQPLRTDVRATGAVPDLAKWVGAFVALAGGIAGFYYWSDESLLLRVIGLLVLSAVALFVAVQTEKGRATWDFVRESHTEVRKVVWPTRKETTQTTLIVIAMVGLVAIIMWILDGLLAWLVKLLLGTGT